MVVPNRFGAGRCAVVAALALGLAALPAAARRGGQSSSPQSTGDPVADAARKAREQKKDSPKPKKVYTEDDIRRLPGAVANGSPAAAADAPETAAAESGAEEKAAEAGAAKKDDDETVWRKRFREARDKLAQAEKELDILQRESEKAQIQYYADPQKALSEQYNRKDILEKDTKIAAKKLEIEQAKANIGAMEEQLRQSGGNSGWAR